jgi:hypothetical protein
MAKRAPAASVKLRPQNPFDLIRLLARSQSDPRKAVAELVQNSLDAGASRIELTWLNEKGRRVLRIWDDGGGIFPELERDEALRRIATTIGHSHKRHLSPSERRELMILGKYGIGLIGFWSVSQVMEIESRVDGGATLCLRLFEDEERAELTRVRQKALADEPTYTEITLRGLHEAAARVIRPPRLQAYLAGELRGQLLERGAELSIHDRVSRGTALKLFQVKPQPFLGAPLADLRVLEVPGHEDARLELYFVSAEDERSGRVALACGGATVLDDVALVDGVEMPRPVWASGRLEGVIDYPELEVAPGTRRGFAPNAAAEAFLRALDGLERELDARLAEENKRQEAVRTQSMARDIRRAFRSVASRLPEYELFDVKAGPRDAEPEPPESGAALEASEDALAPTSDVAPPSSPESAGALEDERPGDGQLFPPGPLARVKLVPASLRVPPDVTRTLRARALDADGRAAEGPLTFTWQLDGPGELVPDGDGARYAAPSLPALAVVRVVARSGTNQAESSAEVETSLELLGREKVGGIPEPRPVNAPGEPWRSRLRADVWEYNESHPDYRMAAETDASRLRYLIHLFAKEVVLRNFGRPGDGELLERLVQVLTHLTPGNRR